VLLRELAPRPIAAARFARQTVKLAASDGVDVDAIERALAAAREEEQRLAAQVDALEEAEQRILEVVRARHDLVAAHCGQAAQELAEVDGRVREIEVSRRQVELSRKKKLRKVRNVVVRFSLCSVALVGWLMASTTGIEPGTGLLLFVTEVGSLWWLADLADHLELRDG
jgi:hypothetical protein